MRPSLSRVCVGVLVLLSRTAAFAAEPAPVNALAKHVPAEAMLFIAVDGNNDAFAKTALHDILAEPEMKATFQGPLAALSRLVSGAARAKTGLDLDILMPLLKTKVGFAFLGIAPPAAANLPPRPEFLLLAEVGRPDSPASKSVGLLIDHFLNRAGMPPDAFKVTKVAGVAARVTSINGIPVGYATTGGMFVLGSGDALRKVLDANTTKLSATREFQRVAKLTGANELLLVHYEHQALLRQFGPMLRPDRRAALQHPHLGFDNVRSVTVSVAPDGRGIRSAFLLRTNGAPKGILKIFAGRPLDPAIVKLAPRRTKFFYATSFDIGAFLDLSVAMMINAPDQGRDLENYRAAMAKFRDKMGFDLRKDFLACVGDEFAVFGPGLTGAVKLTDPARFKGYIQTMLMKAGEAMREQETEFKRAQFQLRTLTYHGRAITYLDGTGFPFFVQPCYTMVGKYAVVSPYPASLKAYIDEMAGGASLADGADFKAVRSKIGPGASSIYYADSAAFLREVYGLLPLAAGLLKMVPEKFQPLCPDPALLPPPGTIARHLFGSTSGCRVLNDGLLWEAYSPVGLPTPPALGQGGGLASAAVFLGMLLPVVAQGRAAAGEAREAAAAREREILMPQAETEPAPRPVEPDPVPEKRRRKKAPELRAPPR